jgi:hypothetical protein
VNITPEVQALIEAARRMFNTCTHPKATKDDMRMIAKESASALAPFSESSPQTLTEEQKRVKEYIEKKGVRCLYCNDYHIEGRSIDIEAGVATQRVDCNNCGASWIDAYDLAHVEPMEGPNISVAPVE